MNYEQFYQYLDTRPVAEIKACMNNLGDLLKKHTAQSDNSNETRSSLQSLQFAQRTWTQQAVCNKFGAGDTNDLSLEEVAQEASALLPTKEVAQYIVDVTEQINVEAEQLKGLQGVHAASTNRVSTAVLSTPSSPSTKAMSTPVSDGGSAVSTAMSPRRSHIQMCGTRPDEKDSKNITGFKRHRYNKNAGNRSIWSEAEDKALEEAVVKIKDQGWVAIAERVGGGKSVNQCQQRWSGLLQHTHSGVVKGADWTESQLVASFKQLLELERLVLKHTVEPHWSEDTKRMTQQRIDWTAVGKEMNRVPHDCNAKWKPIALAKITNAPFSTADDALILRREKEWGDRGVGLWAALEKEMQRPSRNIRRRWKELFP